MKTGQVAAQLFTLREYCKTAADIAVTLKKVRKIGYQAVQVSGVAPIDEKELKNMLDGEGLVCNCYCVPIVLHGKLFGC